MSMSWINAYIALCALFFAVFEIKIKIHNEAIEKTGELYCKILSICRHLKGQVLSVMKLSEKIEQFSDNEVIGYANSYLKNENLTILINEIESLIFPSFNLNNKEQEIEAAKKIFYFTSLAITLDSSVTAFYQGILAGSKYQVSEIIDIYLHLNKYLTIIEKNDAKTVVIERLINLNKERYNPYFPWIKACLLAFFIIIIINIIDNFSFFSSLVHLF